MKPQHVIALVVVAILGTVVIEELRISKMRAEIIRLRAIPNDKPSKLEAGEESLAEETLPAEPPAPPTASKPESPAPSPVLASGRQVPEDFPEPEDARVKQLALSPYADFALDHGLTNREWAYLEELLTLRAAAIQEAAGKWIAASSAERPALSDAINLLAAQSDDAINSFFGNDADFKAFKAYNDMQPEREMLAMLSTYLDSAGATLEIDKEKQLIEALYQARVGTGSLDWNSPAALTAIAEGGALERFEKEWKAQGEALSLLLPKFLSGEETTAVLEARETLKPDSIASIESAIEAINGGSE